MLILKQFAQRIGSVKVELCIAQARIYAISIPIDVVDIVPSLSGDQVTIGQNPTSNHLYVKTKFGQAGKINLKINDLRATQIYSDQLDLSLGIYNKDIQLQGFAAGTYFLTIYFKPIIGPMKFDGV